MTFDTKKYKAVVMIFLPFVLLILGFTYLNNEKYTNCLLKNFSLCIFSKKYVSPIGKFIFRYPNDYPITAKTGEELIKKYHSDFNSDEWVNFSSEFYPNAGGDRLGSIIVEKNSTYKVIKEYADKELSNFEVPPIIEYVKIGGRDAVCSSLKQQPHSFNPPSYDCYLIYKEQLFRISFDYNDYYHKQPLRYYEKARDLILSTFSLN